MAKVDPTATDRILKVSEDVAIRYYVAQEQINLKAIKEKHARLTKEIKQLNKILNDQVE